MALDHFLALLYSSRGEQDRLAGPDCSLHVFSTFHCVYDCTCSTINFTTTTTTTTIRDLSTEQDRVAGPDCSLHPRRMFPVCPVISSSQVLPPTQMNIKLQNTKVQCIENTIRLKALNQANTVLILVQLNCSIPVTLTDVGVCSPIHQII